MKKIPTTRQGMSFVRIERIVTQQIDNVIEVIAVYEAKTHVTHDSEDQVVHSRTDKTSDGPEVKAKDEIIASTWNLVDRSLTSAKIGPLSGIDPSTVDTKGMLGVERQRVDRIQRSMSYAQRDLRLYVRCYNDAEGEELDMRQRQWLELLRDFDCETRYNPGKAIVVADALSRNERAKPLRMRALSDDH
ncbi:hypothetical protein Tco_0656794 [Tanacetum coccineum]|uniref:Uncharacterized protein n=1 Tax=Tanacetum coccineum TaxID=301880 RepID=A0ABQ4X9R9_9ASTR